LHDLVHVWMNQVRGYSLISCERGEVVARCRDDRCHALSLLRSKAGLVYRHVGCL
jgi:hypothetical protein